MRRLLGVSWNIIWNMIKQRLDLNDSELSLLISKGDRTAFTQLYNKYLHNILRFISSICYSQQLSEEIVQELFLKLWLNRENLAGVTAIKPYLYQSAKNLLLNHLKKIQTENKVIHLMELNRGKLSSILEDEIAYNEYHMMAQTAIDLLPVKRKEIFKLRLNEDLSLDEISAKLCISKSVVKKQLYSGISFVRSYLMKHGEISIWLIALRLFLRK